MTQEDKQLLLQDLCARLPYGVKVLDNSHKDYGVSNLINIGVDGSILIDNEMNDIQYYPIIDNIKPYLRSISSMTKEEKAQMAHDCYVISLDFEYTTTDMVALWNTPRVINWLNAHHFDYRGLIEKGLAIEVTEENNPYKE